MAETPELRAVKRWAKNAREGLAGRDAQILRARDAGHSLREIAAAAGMSHGAIRKIVERDR